jgi:hypothetical protein
VKHIKVTSSSPDFQTKVEEAGKGEFKIDVQPKETNSVIASTLTIQPEDSQKVFYATARITNAPAVPVAPAGQNAPAAPVAPAGEKAPAGQAPPAAPPAPTGQTH